MILLTGRTLTSFSGVLCNLGFCCGELVVDGSWTTDVIFYYLLEPDCSDILFYLDILVFMSLIVIFAQSSAMRTGESWC